MLNRDLLAGMGPAARQTAREHSWDQAAARILEVYEEIRDEKASDLC